MGFLWALIVGGLIGWVASLLIGRDVPGGVIGNIVAGFIGAMIGQSLFGTWGPDLAGFAIIPAILGAIILIFIVSIILRALSKKR
ncbi:GlsB/YeaQ/YmgE family stress response membrane protein [Exiguobacterium flavidum]|uniref:GlsB/YeaQ/YmgE family stress response membrane protein n=1 Tax=Exiguobacterium flavidum TaxID=2184695 RepID=UPI000DF7846C|nr:GlsB/YeaQ/YmgE family stress response membrane protein [Exiguobacterium flavidum]